MTEPLDLDAPRNPHQALSLVRMLWKRKRIAVALWVVLSALAVGVAFWLPPVYKAEAVVLVDSQKIPDTIVTSTVRGDVADRLAMISQNVMTSDRLLGVIEAYHLYENGGTRPNSEELLHRMHEDITVNFEKNWTGDRMKAFRLGYQGRKAQVVADVANRLAGLYVAENVRAREDQAVGTVDFLQHQLAEAKRSLDDQEQKVARFKQQHNGALPEQENSLLATLGTANTELQGVQASIARAQANRVALESALSAAESSEASMRSNLQHIAGGTVENGRTVRRSEVLLEQLRAMRLRYTPDHPDVQALERQVMEARHAEAAEAEAADAGGAVNGHGDKDVVASPELIQQHERVTMLRGQVESARREIESLERQREQTTSSVGSYQARIGRLPLVEQEMIALKRDYDESAANYNSLLQKSLAAGMATDMERLQKSERFAIVDPARVPQVPEKPKRLVVGLGGSVAALVVAVLVALALESRGRKLLGEWELPAETTVLGRVPPMGVSA